MEKEVVKTIYELAEKVLEERISPELLERQLLEEIVKTGYGFESEQEVLVNLYIKMFYYMASKKDFTACSVFLQMLAENIRYIQQKENSWIQKSNALINEMQIKKKSGNPVKKIRMETGELFSQQNRDVSTFDYNRLDTVVRYLAIENYYGENDYGFYLYEKMQGARMGQDYIEHSVQKYKELIASFEQNGYKEESEIMCDADFKLLDGSHRLALCLYHGVSHIGIKRIPQKSDITYGIEWFQENGFTQEEIGLICEKCIELMERYIEPFTCILWPPVYPYFDEITKLLGSAYEIVSCEDYEYTEETFTRLVRGVYHIDDIEAWKIEKKLSYMQVHQPKKVRLIKLFLLNADFRLKQRNQNSLSKAGEYIKQVIRSNYQDKVENYFYDIIIHTGDNYRQNRYISKLFEQAFSLRDYLEKIKDYPYILIKQEAPYQTKDFPDSYAFSKDLDILVLPEDYDKLVEFTIAYFQEHAAGYELLGLEAEENYRVRIELNGYLIFQVDISKRIKGIKDTFLEKCIADREETDGYYAAPKGEEICIRINELLKNPDKKHHWMYVEKYKEYAGMELIEEAFEKVDRIPEEIKERLRMEQ